jgi:outer membrane protein TolC
MKKFLFLILLAAPAYIHGQSLSLSLKEAQAFALDSSYAMRSALYDIANAEKEVKEVLATGLPQISADADYRQFLEIPVQLLPAEIAGGSPGDFVEIQFGVKHNITGSITATQLLFDGTYLVGLRASQVYLEQTQNLKTKTETEVRVAVAQAYYTVLVAEANIEILRENLANVETTLNETIALYENGLTEEQDVDQLTLNRNQIRINIDNTEKYHTIAKQTLNFTLGIPINYNVILTDKIETLVQLNDNPEYLMSEPMIETHPDMLIARTNFVVKNLMLDGERAAYYPRLDAFITHQQNAQRNQFNFTDTNEPWFPATILGVNLSVPIFSSFQRNHRVSRAKIEVERAEMQLTQAEENLLLEITRARSEYDNALKNWNNQKESLELARKINQRTRIKYTEGISSSFELNVADTQLLNEQNKYIGAALDLLNAKQELNKALNIF